MSETSHNQTTDNLELGNREPFDDLDIRVHRSFLRYNDFLNNSNNYANDSRTMLKYRITIYRLSQSISSSYIVTLQYRGVQDGLYFNISSTQIFLKGDN